MTRYLVPGSVLGILGGGAVGRSIALAARELGYRVRAVDADPSCTVGGLAERSVLASVDDVEAATRILAGCDVVTPSVEEIPLAVVAAITAAGIRVRPSPGLIGIAQDRVLEREWLQARGTPLVPWRAATTLDDALVAVATLGGPCVLKPALRRREIAGVRRVRTAQDVTTAWHELGGARCVVEAEVDIDRELSVVVARGLCGDIASYPAAESARAWHDGTPRLLWSVLPANGEQQHSDKARRLASTVTERLGTEGLLAVEMFLLADGRLVVNEIVPCPHGTYVAAGTACATGQDEQLVRSICGLPLGSTAVVRPVAVAPIYGDDWLAGASRRLGTVLSSPGITCHLDGIDPVPPHARVGHLTVTGVSGEQAVARAMRAAAHLAGRSHPSPRRAPSAVASR